MLNNDYSIYCNNSYGPWTYNFGFDQPNQIRKIKHCGPSINSHYEKGSEILTNNSGVSKYFEVKDVEVYKII